MNPRQLLRKFNARYLPCYVISRRPMILAAYENDFLAEKEAFAAALRSYPRADLLLELGWQHETDRVLLPFLEALAEVRRMLPGLRITVLTNSPVEAERLTAGGVRAIHCHHNSFLHESHYRIRPEAPKEFDAVYVARITPFKRHYLASRVKSLRLIGDYYGKEQEYVDSVFAMFPDASYTRKVAAARIDREINRACCGLCLSAEEGGMFVSTEYMLCGVPVVNTANLGGRDGLFPEFAVRTVEDTPEAVAEAVAAWKQTAPPPREIRDATIAILEEHRSRFRKLLDEIFQEAHQENPAIPPRFRGRIPHKLGLRCTRLPWVSLLHGLVRQ